MTVLRPFGPFRAAVLGCTLSGLLSGCLSAMPPSQEGAELGTSALTVGQALAHAATLQGRTVTVEGLFAGWSGPCKGGPPRTRSDWMLVDGPHCIYVSGAVPQGLTAPPDATSNGKPVKISATLHVTEDGRPYLQRPRP